MNPGMADFRYGPPQPIPPANPPAFVGQAPNAMQLGMNGPFNPRQGGQNNRFSNNNNNANNRGFQQHGVQKRMRRY